MNKAVRKAIENTESILSKRLNVNFTINKNYNTVITEMCNAIINNTTIDKVKVVPCATGIGKSTCLIESMKALIEMKNIPKMGTVIFTRRIEDCNKIEEELNNYATSVGYDRNIAITMHSKNDIKIDDTRGYPILILTQEKLTKLIENGLINDSVFLYSWFDNGDEIRRLRIIIDEEFKLLTDINIDYRNDFEDLIKYALSKKMKDLAYEVEMIKLNIIKAIKEKDEHVLTNVDLKPILEILKHTVGEDNRKFKHMIKFANNGGLVKLINGDIHINSYSVLELWNLLLPVTILDGTANINSVFTNSDKYDILDVPNIKSYNNLEIYIDDTFSASRSTMRREIFTNNKYIDEIIKKINKHNEKVLVIVNDMDQVEDILTKKLGSNTNVSIAHFGNITGTNDFHTYGIVYIFGYPIYANEYYVLQHIGINYTNNDEVMILTEDMCNMQNKDGARRFLDNSIEQHRISRISIEVIQAINRARCRKYKDGDCEPTKVFMFCKDNEIVNKMKYQMPNVQIKETKIIEDISKTKKKTKTDLLFELLDVLEKNKKLTTTQLTKKIKYSNVNNLLAKPEVQLYLTNNNIEYVKGSGKKVGYLIKK